MGPRAHQAAALISQMGEFDLQRAFAGAGAPSEDLQDEAGAIEHLSVPCFFQIALLHRGERAIHHHEPGIKALHHAGELVDFALSDKGCWVDLAQRRDPGLDNLELDRPRETDRLIEPGRRRAVRRGASRTHASASVARVRADHDRAPCPRPGRSYSVTRITSSQLQSGLFLEGGILSRVEQLNGVTRHDG